MKECQNKECMRRGFAYSDRDKFCSECGSVLVPRLKCTECGEEVSPRQKYCTNCGKNLMKGGEK